jgi:hypothetical protein
MVKTVAERFWPKVDKTEDCWLWTACIRKDGYGSFRVLNKTLLAHRVAYALVRGVVPELDLDHTCHTRHCVNPAHLRPVTHKQNLENRQGAQANSASGIRGVSWDKKSQKWRGYVTHNKVRLSLGFFDSPEQAEAVVKAKRLEVFTHSDMDTVVK